MGVKISRTSRLRFGTLLDKDGVEFWDLLEFPPIPQRSDDVQHTVTDRDRYDSLAFRYYGDSTLWWVIAVANDMEILPTDMHSGKMLRIPSPSFVLNELFTLAKSF